MRHAGRRFRRTNRVKMLHSNRTGLETKPQYTLQMDHWRCISALVLLALFSPLFQSCAGSRSLHQEGLVGRIWVVGNEPFTRLVIELDNKQMYYIKNESPVFKSLWGIQGERVHLDIAEIDPDTEEILVSRNKIVQ